MTTITDPRIRADEAHPASSVPVAALETDRTDAGSPLWMWLAVLGSLLGTLSLPWDIANHIENIRDEVLYPAHLGLLAGLGTWAVAGAMSVIRRPLGTPLHARRGGLLCAVGASTAFLTFPLDAAWHELFGIDVTLWGPTHLVMMLGGSIASLGVFAMVADHARGRGRIARIGAMLAGAFPLSAMLAYLLEYAFDVPQFSLLYPTLISSLAIGLSLVAVRVALGRGAALVATAGFLVLSVGIVSTWLVLLDYNPTHVRLMLPAAILVEAAYLWTPRRHAAWVAGALVGSIGVLGEWAWNVATVDDYPSGAIMAVWWIWPASIATAVIASYGGDGIGRAIARRPDAPAPNATERTSRRSTTTFAVGVAAIALLLALPLLTGGDDSIDVDVRPTDPEAARSTFLFTIDDDAMDDVESASVVSGHGGDLIVRQLERVGVDTWRTTQPSPITGDWFTSLRLMRANEIQGLALRAPGGSVYGDEVSLREGAATTRAVEAVPTGDHPPIIPALAYVIVVLAGAGALWLTRFALARPSAA